MRLAFLLSLLVVPQDVATLVEQLKSEDPATRESAAGRLVGFGTSVIEELKLHEQNEDRDFCAQIKSIILEIQRRERIRVVHGPIKRLTLSVTNIPTAEAIDRVLSPFGLRAMYRRSQVGSGPSVTVELREATLWEAFDALEKAAAVGLDQPLWPFSGHAMWGRDLNFVPMDQAARTPYAAESNLDDMRLFGAPMQDKGSDDVSVEAWVVLPPGAVPISVELDGVELMDDRGRRLDPGPAESHLGTVRHRMGCVTIVPVWKMKDRLDRACLRDAKSFTLKGTLVVDYPYDLERTEAALEDLKQVTRFTIGDVSLEVVLKMQDDFNIDGAVNFRSKIEGNRFYGWVWLEDREGRWIVDFPRIGHPVGNGAVSGNIAPFRTPPVKVVAARIAGSKRVKVPFLLDGISIPPIEKR